jgi:hypothetical protein
MDVGPEGRPPTVPSREGLGINPEDDLPAPACRGSAVGAALNLAPLASNAHGSCLPGSVPSVTHSLMYFL